jgi:hypothetical protein
LHVLFAEGGETMICLDLIGATLITAWIVNHYAQKQGRTK